MSRAFADAIRTAGFAEEVALDTPSGLSVTVFRSHHDRRALLHIEERPGAGRRVRYVLAADDVTAQPARTVARATALLAEPAPEHCFASVDELAVAIIRQDKLARRGAAAHAGGAP